MEIKSTALQSRTKFQETRFEASSKSPRVYFLRATAWMANYLFTDTPDPLGRARRNLWCFHQTPRENYTCDIYLLSKTFPTLLPPPRKPHFLNETTTSLSQTIVIDFMITLLHLILSCWSLHSVFTGAYRCQRLTVIEDKLIIKKEIIVYAYVHYYFISHSATDRCNSD